MNLVPLRLLVASSVSWCRSTTRVSFVSTSTFSLVGCIFTHSCPLDLGQFLHRVGPNFRRFESDIHVPVKKCPTFLTLHVVFFFSAVSKSCRPARCFVNYQVYVTLLQLHTCLNLLSSYMPTAGIMRKLAAVVWVSHTGRLSHCDSNGLHTGQLKLTAFFSAFVRGIFVALAWPEDDFGDMPNVHCATGVLLFSWQPSQRMAELSICMAWGIPCYCRTPMFWEPLVFVKFIYCLMSPGSRL